MISIQRLNAFTSPINSSCGALITTVQSAVCIFAAAATFETPSYVYEPMTGSAEAMALDSNVPMETSEGSVFASSEALDICVTSSASWSAMDVPVGPII